MTEAVLSQKTDQELRAADVYARRHAHRWAAFELTAALCALPETTLKDGHDYIRRDRVMDLIATWRRKIDGRQKGRA